MTTYFTIGLVLFIINILIAFIWEKTPDDFWIRILYAIFPFNSLAKTQFTWSPLAAGKAGKVSAMINCYNGR